MLDAAELLPDGCTTTATLVASSAAIELRVAIDLRRGKMEDRVVHDRGTRVVARDAPLEASEPHPPSSTHPIPPCTYVDVSAPFLLGGHPFDGRSRAIYTWICDRFIAKVYYESRGKKTLTVPAGRFEAHEVVMYPDLNDWVSLPGIITKLSKPFLPKYHMWYEVEPPHRLVFFEGPHGPPGAPEIILELESEASASSAPA